MSMTGFIKRNAGNLFDYELNPLGDTAQAQCGETDRTGITQSYCFKRTTALSYVLESLSDVL
jgi:hypothetical protein